MKSRLGAVVLFGVLTASMVGCSPSQSEDPSPSPSQGQTQETEEQQTPEAPETSDADEQALQDYVEAEREQIPQVMEMYPGIYSDVEVEGRVDTLDGATYSIVQFDYMYAERIEWSEATGLLDEQIPDIEELCSTVIFPAMTQFGVTGPMAVTYTYDDGQGGSGPMWEYTCTSQ